MNCAVHPEHEAVGYCRNCGKALCAACTRTVRDVLYCEDCLASQLAHAAPATTTSIAQPQVSAGAPHPVLAFFLGFLPGLGAFYNEQYGKGLVFLAVFLILFITGVNAEMSGGALAALWICLAALWIYMPIDAHRTARARLAGQTPTDPLDSWSKNRPIGPLILIGIGMLALLSNFGLLDWYRWGQLWPLILIAAGILMLRKRLGRAA